MGQGGQQSRGPTVLTVVSSGPGGSAESRANSADSGKWWARGGQQSQGPTVVSGGPGGSVESGTNSADSGK